MQAAPRLGLVLALAPAILAAQGGQGGQGGQHRWTVDPQSSLVWWQIDPHYNHLWATTCPADPSWQPGEGRDEGWQVDYATRPVTRDAGISDARVPLFPRRAVHPACRPSVRGEVLASEDGGWRGARGSFTIAADSFETGSRMRDGFARRHVLDVGRYPTIRFTLDSLIDVQAGDTVRATAIGKFWLHGVETDARVPVVAWREAAGLRVQGRFSMDAQDLVHKYGMSPWALGMGVVMHRWKTVYMGLDLVLREAAS